MKLLEVGKPLGRCLEARLLTIYGLTKELFCADLLRSFRGFSTLMIKPTEKRYLPGALFLTLGGPREASIFADGPERQR